MKKTLKRALTVLLSMLMICGSCFMASAEVIDTSERKIEYIKANLADFMMEDVFEVLVPENTIFDDFKGFAPSGEFTLKLDFTEYYAITADVTVKYDIPEEEYQIETVVYPGALSPIEAVIYITDDAITVKSEAIFGTNKVYGFESGTLKELINKFEASPIGKLLGFEPGTFEEYYYETEELNEAVLAVETAVDACTEFVKKVVSMSGDKLFKRNLIEQLLNESVVSVNETQLTVDGQPEKVYAAKVDISEEAYANVLNSVFEVLSPELEELYSALGKISAVTGNGSSAEETQSMLMATTEETLNSIRYSGSATYYFANTGIAVIAADIDLDMVMKADGKVYSDMDIIGREVFGDRIAMAMIISDNIYRESVTVVADLGLVQRHGFNRWDAVVDFIVENTSVGFETYFEHNEENEKYELGVQMIQRFMLNPVMSVDINKVLYKFNGDIKVTEDSFEVSVTDITEGKIVYESGAQSPSYYETELSIPKITLSYKADAEIFAPKKYTDLFGMSEAQIYSVVGKASKRIERYLEKIELIMLQGKNYDENTTKLYGITKNNYSEYSEIMSESEFSSFVDAYKYYIDINTSH